VHSRFLLGLGGILIVSSALVISLGLVSYMGMTTR
jgi:hypothetical protein